MPFGVIFAALVLGIVCPWYGVSAFTAGGSAPDRIAGVAWTIAGIAIAAALLARQRWSRACGIAASLVLAVEGIRLVLSRGEPLEAALFLAGLTSAVLLAFPRTGRSSLRASSADGLVAVPRSRAGVALIGTICLFAVVGWNVATDAVQVARPEGAGAARAAGPDPGAFDPARSAAPPAGSRALRATAAPQGPAGIEWTTFAEGLAAAKSRKTSMFVEFYATWCGACKSMDRGTFRDVKVARRLQDVVAVRVNAEEEVARGGLKGVDLATRFEVEAYPTLLVLDSSGKEVARLVGAPGASGFLRWLEDALASGAGTRAAVPNDPVRIAKN